MAKSQATLDNEAAIKAAIAHALKEPVQGNPHDILLNPLVGSSVINTGTWSLVKGHTDIYQRTGQLSPTTAAMFTRIREALLTHWGVIGMQLGHSTWTGLGLVNRETTLSMPTFSVKVPVIVKERSWMGKAPAAEIVHHIHTMPLTDRAAFMTWPDALGKVKVISHKNSVSAIGLRDLLCTGFRPDRLTTADWPVLADYLEGRKKINLPVNQQAVCAIVKAISNRLSEQAIAKMIHTTAF